MVGFSALLSRFWPKLNLKQKAENLRICLDPNASRRAEIANLCCIEVTDVERAKDIRLTVGGGVQNRIIGWVG
jgi:hypothetical protein